MAVRALQRAAGNEAVSRLLAPESNGDAGSSRPLAFKRIGEPSDDPLEREADAAAERALAGPKPQSGRGVAPLLARGVAHRTGSPPPREAAQIIASLDGRGAPLTRGVRAELEPRLGADFSAVRIHTGPEAAEAARAVDAVAFTSGPHVVFGRGAFDPHGREGKRLIAHELAHTVQQGAAPQLSGGTHGVRQVSRAPAVQRQAEPAPSGGIVASLVAQVSPGLADVIREGPLSWIGRKLKAAVQAGVGALVDGLGLGDAITAFRGAFDRALELLARLRKGGADACAAFKEILETLHDLGSAIAESEAVRRISDAVNTVSDGLGKLVKLVVGGTLDELKPLLSGAWSLISGAASTVWGWIKAAKAALGSAWDWVVERLGLGGADSQDGVWAWIKRHAARAWDSIKQTLAPVAGPLATAGKVLFALSPFGPVYVVITYGPEVVRVVAFLWSHRNDPNIVRTAHKEMSDTFLPGLLDGTGNLRQKLGEAADWLLEKLGSLAGSALELAGSISGLPLLDAAKGFARRLAEDVRSFFSWGQEKLRDGVQWLTGAAKKLWSIIEPYKEVLGSIALAIAAPPTIPLILAGWAWRKIPRCYKAPIIDFILDIAIAALSALPGVETFGPLWLLLKPGVLAFLRKLKQAQDWVKEKVSDRVAKILSGASPGFLLGFVKGFLQGIWEGLTDPFKAIATVIDALNWIKDLLAGLAARALGLTPPPATPKITAILEGEPEKEQPKETSAADTQPLFKDEPAPAAGAPPAPTAAATAAPSPAAAPGAASAPAASAAVGAAPASTPTAAVGAPAASTPTAAAVAAPGAAPEPSTAGSTTPASSAPGSVATPEDATAGPAPTGPTPATTSSSPTPEAASTSSATAAASGGATGQGAPGGSTLAGPGSAQASEVPQGGSGSPGTAGQPERAAPAAPAAAAKTLGIDAQAPSPASPPPVPAPVGPQPDIADLATQAISDIQPDVDKAATGFWPAIKEYFSSSSSTSFDELLAKLGEAWEAIKGKIAEAGTEVAKKITAFFVGDQAEEEIGHATGWLGGTITFQLLLDALTAGTWTGIMGVLQSIAKFINWPMEVMGEAFKLLSKLGAYLLDGLKALVKVVKEAGGGAIRAVTEAIGSIARKFVHIAETLVGRVGGAVERRGAAALEREGGHLAATEAGRLEQKQLVQGLEREGPKAGPAAREAKEARAAEADADQALKQEQAAAEEEAKAAKEREGERGRETGERTFEEAEAIAAARVVDATLQAEGAPVGSVRPALLGLRAEFPWIKDFQVKPVGPGVYEVFLVASPATPIGPYIVRARIKERGEREELPKTRARVAKREERANLIEKAQKAGKQKAKQLRKQAGTLSEELGELGTIDVVKKRFTKAKRIHWGEGSGTLDFVYEDLEKGEEIIRVFEAKGGAGRAGTRMVSSSVRAEQGTVTYLREVVEAMKKRGGKEADVAKKVEEALNEGRLRYYLTSTRIPVNEARPLTTRTTEFLITGGKG